MLRPSPNHGTQRLYIYTYIYINTDILLSNCLTHILYAGLDQVHTIYVDPENNKLYFAAENIEVMNTDGSERTTLIRNTGLMATSLAVDLKKR